MEETRNVYKVLVVQLEGKRQLGRYRNKMEESSGMGVREKGWCGLDSSGSGYGSVTGCCEHGNELLCYKKRFFLIN
jgi:hypothetical protein